MSFYRAVVVSRDDPENLGRVRLQIPQLFGEAVTNWATPLDNYLVEDFTPDVGEIVWASFEGTDHTYPVYLPSFSRARAANTSLKIVRATASLSSKAVMTVSAVG